MYRGVLKTRRDAKFLIRLVSAEPSIMNVSNSLYANKYIVGLPMLHHDGDDGGGESVDVVIIVTNTHYVYNLCQTGDMASKKARQTVVLPMSTGNFLGNLE